MGGFIGYISVPFVATPNLYEINGAPITSCAISPTLPNGLTIDPITCVVSGIPTVSIPQGNYTITVTNSAGVGYGTLPMIILPSVPVLSYAGVSGTGSFGSYLSITPSTLVNNGAWITSCTISPALPSGLWMDNYTCSIFGTASQVIPLTTFTVSAANSAGVTTAQIPISIAPTPPNLSYEGAVGKTGFAQSPRTIIPRTFNYGGVSLTNCTISPALPTGLSISPTNCVISGTALYESTTTTYTVTATNVAGTGSTTLDISVSPIPPTLSYSSSTGTSGLAQNAMSITPSSLNAGGTTITNCTISPALPAGSNGTNGQWDLPFNGLSIHPTTCVISGTPPYESPLTTYTITIHNSAGTGTATVALKIDPIPPTLSYSGATGTVGKMENAMSISPTGLNKGGTSITNCTTAPALPEGLSINTTTCVISGTPVGMSDQDYVITIHNSKGTGTANLRITVGPNLPILSYSGSTGTNGQWDVPFSVTPTSLRLRGSNLSSCTISPALPTGLSINQSTCVISGTPKAILSPTVFTITPTNIVGSGTPATVTLSLIPNIPILSYSGSTGTSGQWDVSMSVPPTTRDTRGASITTCSISPALPTGLSINQSTCEISGVPTVTLASTTFTITPQNSAGNGASTTVTLSVAPNTPVLSYSGSSGTSGQWDVPMSITPTTLNNRGSSVTGCSISPALPTGLSINQSSCVISGTPKAILSSASFTVTASNAAGNGSSTTVTLTIVPNIPIISYSGASGTTGNAQSFRSITPTTLDTRGAGVTVCQSSPALPDGLSIHQNSCVISGTPSTAQSATTYTITATSSAGASSSTTVSIAVSAITPTISYSASTGNIHSARTITPTVNTGGSTISNCTASLPAGLSIAPTTCIISGTPTASQTATNHTVTITTAAGLSNTGTVSITVSPIAPALSYASASGTVNSVLTINPSSINSNGATTTCTTSGLPGGLSVNSSCVISGTPTTAGSASYTITATNSAGSTNATITITIAAIAPTLSYSGASGISGQVNSAMSISPTGLTTGGAPITHCTGTLPAGLTLNTNCLISGTPTWAQVATSHTITIRNSSNLTSTASVSITIAARLPTISFSGASSGNVGVARIITPTTYNGGTNISNCTISPALPAGLSISNSTCVISGTPSTIFGPNTYTVTIHNSAGTGTGTISISATGYHCTNNSFDGPAGWVGSINSCFYDCNLRNRCGGLKYYPNSFNSCYDKTYGLISENCYQVFSHKEYQETTITGSFIRYCYYSWMNCSCSSSYFIMDGQKCLLADGRDGGGSIGCENYSCTSGQWVDIYYEQCDQTWGYICQ